MDCAAPSDAQVSLPPDEVREVVQQCFTAAKERLAAFRARKIQLNVKTARRQAERRLRRNNNGHPRHENGKFPSRNVNSIPESIFAVPSDPKDKVTMTSVPQCPGGLSWIRVRSNMRAADQGKDSFFVPYIGESEQHLNFSNKLAADTFELDTRVPDDISEDEDLEEEEEAHGIVREERPLEKSKRSNKSLKNAKNTGPTSLPTTRRKKTISQRVWTRAAMRVALKSIFEVLGCASLQPIADVVRDVLGFGSIAQAAKCVTNIAYRQRKYEEADREEKTKRSYRAEMVQILNGSVKPGPSEILKGDSIPFFICRQCYTYNCFLHGNHTAKPSNTIPDKTRKDSSTRQISRGIEFGCQDRTKNKCWHIDEALSESRSWWREVQRDDGKAADIRAAILEFHGVFGADPCRIAILSKFLIASFHSGLEITCCRVGYLFSVIEGIRPVETKHKSRRRFRRSTGDSYKSKRKKMRMEDESGLKGGLRKDFEPCKHAGPCTAKSCPCYLNGVNCEKYCSCNHTRSHQDRAERRLTCPNAFKGCSCKSSVACVSNACICYSWKRECDPDLCKTCHECKGDREGRSCENDGLLMGKRKRIVVGHSDTHGWGAFAATPVNKNEVIGEYVGEIVDQEHADRRGRLYDEVQYSFLFNITDDFALDSTRVGNKLRYCNHAFEPNCEARLMRVAGDIRVGLYAKRDIGKHEELFFDYKYKFGPDWAVPAKDKKVTGAFKEKRSSVPSAMKQASSNAGEQCTMSSEANGKRGASADPPFQTKIKRAKTMRASTRYQAKNQKTEPSQRRSLSTASKKPNNGDVEEQQAKPSSADVHPVKRPISVWRGVLRRVVPRAAEVGGIDHSGSNQRILSPGPTNLAKQSQPEESRLNAGQSPIKVLKHTDNEAEGRWSDRIDRDSQVNEHDALGGESNLDIEERGRSLKKRSISPSPIDETNPRNTDSLHGTREVSKKPDPPQSLKHDSQTSLKRNSERSNQRIRNHRLLMRQRMKEIFGSDAETDDDDSEADVVDSKGESLPTEKEDASEPSGILLRKRYLASVENKSDSIRSKRRKTALECRDGNAVSNPSLRRTSEDLSGRNASSPFTENRHVRHGRELGIGSEKVSRATQKLKDTTNRAGRARRPSIEARRRNQPDSLRSRTSPGTRIDIGRSNSLVQQSKRGELNRPRDPPHFVHTRQSSRELEQMEPRVTQTEQEPELHIPMVNLVSDDESESNSGSFDPKFF